MIAHERGEEARLRSMQSVRSWGNRGAQENFRNGGDVAAANSKLFSHPPESDGRDIRL